MAAPPKNAKPEYATREARKRHREALKLELEAVLRTRPARAWETELNRLGVPAGAVLSVPEILGTPQIRERGFLNHFENVPGVGRAIDVVTTGIKIDGRALRVSDPPPRLGEHNDEIWSELGLGEQDLAELRGSGTL